MAGSEVNGLVGHTVKLGHGNYQSPLYITATGDIAPTHQGADGILGRAGLHDASINNDGHVSGASGNGLVNGGVGIDMHSAVALTNAGTISGGDTNYTSTNSIYLGGNGVDLSAGGTVTNTGVIAGGAGSFSYNYGGGQGGIGLDLLAGGTITNSATITGGAGGYGHDGGGMGGAGVQLASGGTLVNTGMIKGGEDGQSGYNDRGGMGGTGIVVLAGGVVDNSTGTITGGAGQYNSGIGGTAVQMAGGTLMNGGTVTGGVGGFGYFTSGGNGGTGVNLSGGAVLTNTGMITGGEGGYGHDVGGYGGAGVTVNDATLMAGGTISGGQGGQGGYYRGGGGAGVYIDGGTLIASGAILGGAGYGSHTYPGDAVQFGSHAGTLVIDPNAVFDGVVAAAKGAGDALVLAAGSGGGLLSGLGKDFTNFNSLAIDAGANWTLEGDNKLGGSSVLSDAGTLAVAGTLSDGGVADVSVGGTFGVSEEGSLLVGQVGLLGGTLLGGQQAKLVIGTTLAGAAAGTIVVDGGASLSGFGTISGGPVLDGGAITASGGTLVLASAVSGGGTVSIASAGTLLETVSVSGLSVVFSADATFQIGAGSSVTSTLSGFGSGDLIDLLHVKADSLSFSGGTLTLMQGGSTVDQIALAGNYTNASFALSTDHHGGTDISFVGTDAIGRGFGRADLAGPLGREFPTLQAVQLDFADCGRAGQAGEIPTMIWNIMHSSY